jgi:hypothetical protein
MRKIIAFICLLMGIPCFAQNYPIASINISLPANPSENTHDWGSSIPPFTIIAQARMVNGRVDPKAMESRILVSIRKGGQKICGSYNPQTAPMTGINAVVKTWIGPAATGLLGGDCNLTPGDYEICVQIYTSFAPASPISNEVCKAFTIKGKMDFNFSPPINLLPFKNKEFSEAEIKNPVSFRWTPVLPKPQDPVTYRLKVWQLMQGQSGSTAMRTNQPIVTKDVDNITQAVVTNIYTGPCRPPYLCDYIWVVEAQSKDGKTIGTSEPSSFTVATGALGTYSGPVNILPANNQEFSENEMKNPTSFRWTPVVPKPQEPVTYRLKVWQLMQGQSGSQAMKTNQPIATKEVSDFTETTVSGIWTGPCRPPYLCDYIWSVESQSKDGKTIGTSEPSSFTVATGALGTYSGPVNILPANNQEFSENEMKNSTSFRWTPLVPKPQEPVTYRLKVWQLMQGQSSSQAMKTNKPIATKEVSDFTETTVSGIYTGPCRPPYLCDYIWSVEAISKNGTPIDTSNPTGFKINQPNTILSCCPGTWNSIQMGSTSTSLTTTLPPGSGLLPSMPAGTTFFINTCYTCGTGCGTPTIVYELHHGITNALIGTSVTGTNCTVTAFTIPSTVVVGTGYVFKIFTLCGGMVCDSSKYQFTPSLASCCTGSSWGAMQFCVGTPCVLGPMPPCNSSFSTPFSAGSTVSFNIVFNCAPGCTPVQIQYNAYNSSNILVSSTTGGSGATIFITTPSTPGNYYFKIYGICGAQRCDSCIYKFVVVSCCNPSSWGSTKWGTTPATVNTIVPFGTINATAGSNLFFNVNYNCAPGCGPAQIKYVIYSGSTVIWTNTYPAGLTPAITMPATAGSYVIKFFAICGTQACDSITNKLVLTSCCTGSSWGLKKYRRSGPPVWWAVWTPLPCSSTLLPMHKATITKFQVCYNCPAGCGPATIQYSINGPGLFTWTSAIVASCSIQNIMMPPTTGTATLTIKAFCNGVLCNTCVNKLIIVP